MAQNQELSELLLNQPYKFEQRLDDFVTYFVCVIEIILKTHYDILEGNVSKTGEIPMVISEIIGTTANFFKVGGVAKVVKKCLDLPFEEYYKKQSYKYTDIVYNFHKFENQGRKVFVRIGIDIFKSFEQQFMGVTTEFGPQEALKFLARDAAERLLNFVKEDSKTSELASDKVPEKMLEAQSVIYGKSKTNLLDKLPTQIGRIKSTKIPYPKSKRPGYELEYKSDDVENLWNTANLYEKAGIVCINNNISEFSAREQSKYSKYYFRRPFDGENFNNYKDKIKMEAIVEVIKEFKYTDDSVYLQKQEAIFDQINRNDTSWVQKRSLDFFKDLIKEVKLLKETVDDEIKIQCENAIDFLKKQTELLQVVDVKIDNLNQSVKRVEGIVAESKELTVKILSEFKNKFDSFRKVSNLESENKLKVLFDELKIGQKSTTEFGGIDNSNIPIIKYDNIHSDYCYETLQECLFLLNEGSNPNVCDENGQTLLHWATENGEVDLCRKLLEHGADSNTGDINGFKPLHYAMKNGKEDLCKILLTNGADAKVVDKNGQSLIHWAVGNGKTNLCRLLLEHKADSNAADANGLGPLHYGIKNGKEDVCRLLLEKGASPNATDQNGQSLLHWAVAHGKFDSCKLLLVYKANLNAGDVNGLSPLQHAVANGRLDICELLLEYGANSNATDKNGQSLLHWAAINGKVDLCELLLKYRANIDAGDINGLKPLYRAMENSKYEVCELLLRNKADANASDMNGLSLLHWTAENGKVDLCRLLLEHKANPNAGDVNGLGPLHRAATNGNEEICELLLSNGANAKAADKNGQTLLHWAAGNGKVNICKVLLKYNADYNAGDGNGKSALSLAIENGKEDVRKLFLETQD
ncbi:uncharacterized protein LOC143916740 [Arctopsyche grandis]|uniref:uncharacterized protein LOC143916740 n=1 Tax=Arctopsyche grandis TaxID=121162 RepID=UPI00406D73D3